MVGCRCRVAFSPRELIRALLKAPVDLLWNGGIGTYVKASSETPCPMLAIWPTTWSESMGCRASLPGNRPRPPPEGRQPGSYPAWTRRVCPERRSSSIPDFIDNSAGVDCSDREVNIKDPAQPWRGGGLDRGLVDVEERNQLLKSMTDDVSGLVLRSNYLQTQALSMNGKA